MDPSNGNAPLLYDGGRRCSVFVIDYGEHMFEEGHTLFKRALEVRIYKFNYFGVKF